MSYIPTFRRIKPSSKDERNTLIEMYFNLGFLYKEILHFLVFYHDVQLSMRQLKRILQLQGLKRNGNLSNLSSVWDVIESEIKGSGSCLGYRLMHQKILTKHGLRTDRETVRKMLKLLDPIGVQNRTKHRLRRRVYRSPGPNFVWHLDGYDKLKPFGFCIHGAIDGYSRRILWLEVGVTNNNPKVVTQFYIDYVRQLRAVPRVVRCDCGTENIYISGIQRFFRLHDTDSLAGPRSFMYGKSVSNQRIEGWWSILRKTNSDWWIKFFKDMRDSGIYNDSNPLHVDCLKYCFMPVLRSELRQVALSWNLHRIRKNINSESPPGKPDILYFLPEIHRTRDYKSSVDSRDVDIAEQLYAERLPTTDCSAAFHELAGIIMAQEQWHTPHNAEKAKELYNNLLTHINSIS